MLQPGLNKFLEIWNDSWTALPKGASMADRRLLFEYIAEKMRLPFPPDVALSTFFVQSGERNVLCRMERHEEGGRQPCLIYMHGGGWVQGSPMTHTDITNRISQANRQTVISVDYALAPEHPFPTAIHEVMDVVRWVYANAESLGIDAERIAIGGDSAGANLAAAACVGLNGTHPLPIAQLLIYPATNFDMAFPSYEENADAPLLNTKGMPQHNLMYCGSKENLKHPLAAPLHAETHEGLPSAYIAVAQYDPLRDDGHAYADKLRKAGVRVELDRGEGLIHGYLRAMEYCEASRKSLQRMISWLGDCYAAGTANG